MQRKEVETREKLRVVEGTNDIRTERMVNEYTFINQ